MTGTDMLGVFGDFDPSEHAEEAEERWGGTDAYQQSQQRTAQYTADDWQRLGAESAAIDAAFLELMDAGAEPSSDEAIAVALRHREHITTWFYDCTPEIHTGLAQMYVADPRFAKNIDRARPGLAAYMSAAITAAATA